MAAAKRRRHNRRARLHRQGQRPGALRGRHPGARPRPGCSRRSVTSRGPGTRPSSTPRSTPADETTKRRRTRSTRTLGPRVETGFLEDIWNAPIEDVYAYTGTRRAAGARRGRRPVRERGAGRDRRASRHVLQAIQELNARAGAHGVGRLDMVEDRLVGIKSREVYEAPGRSRCSPRTRSWRSVTVERDLARVQARSPQRWSELVYDGLWFSPLKEALDSFVAASQELRHRRGADDPARRPSAGPAVDARALRLRPGHLRRGRHLRPEPREASCSLGLPSKIAASRAGRCDRSGRDASTPPPAPAPRTWAACGVAGSPPGRRTRWPRCRSPRTSTGGWRPTTCVARWHTPACCTAPGCSPTRSSPACSALAKLDADVDSGAFGPLDDEDVHSALERGLVERTGAELGEAARRPVAQRPGGHALPDVAARRRPPGRLGDLRRRRRAARPGRGAPGRADARAHAPAARPAGAARPPPRRARPRAPARRRPAARLGPAQRGVAVRVGSSGRLVAGAGPGGGRRPSWASRSRPPTPSTAPRPATSPQRPRSCSRWRPSTSPGSPRR